MYVHMYVLGAWFSYVPRSPMFSTGWEIGYFTAMPRYCLWRPVSCWRVGWLVARSLRGIEIFKAVALACPGMLSAPLQKCNNVNWYSSVSFFTQRDFLYVGGRTRCAFRCACYCKGFTYVLMHKHVGVCVQYVNTYMYFSVNKYLQYTYVNVSMWICVSIYICTYIENIKS